MFFVKGSELEVFAAVVGVVEVVEGGYAAEDGAWVGG